jgi:hypothetical protein
VTFAKYCQDDKFRRRERYETRGTQGGLKAYKFKTNLIGKLEGAETTW